MHIDRIISKKLYPLFLQSRGISKDTRTIQKGDLYFALKGGNFNGNKFAQEAIAKGASWVILDELQEIVDTSKVMYVENALITLQQLAYYHRNQLSCHVIGLTGSNGKTTTKELLYNILKSNNPNTYATQGNLNNHIGVPLSILAVPLTAQYAIIEMGTNQPGDIAEYCEIAQPNYGLITNIGKAHLEKLIDQEGIFREKYELFRTVMDQNGVFFQNIGDEFLSKLSSKQLVPFSSYRTIHCDLKKVERRALLAFDIVTPKKTKRVDTKLFGDFNIENIASAITVAEYFKVPYHNIIKAIEDYTPQNMRSQVLATKRNTVILDAYNSNPLSLKAALEEFFKIKVPNKIAIIGDMLELGHRSEEEHNTIVQLLKGKPDIKVILIGNEFYKLASDDSSAFVNVQSCIDSYDFSNIQLHHILLKGSRGIQLEKLLEKL